MSKIRHDLSSIYFHLTLGCNLACKHCWIDPPYDPQGKHPVLDLNLFKSALNEALPLGLKGIKLTGGEPLMHPEIISILALAREQELQITIETNGTLISPEIVAELKKSESVFISVSIDGSDKETHDEMRGIPGSFDLALDGIRLLTASEIHPQIITTLTNNNAQQIGDLIHLAEKMKASSFKLNTVQPTARGEKYHSRGEVPTVKEIHAIFQRINTEIRPKIRIPVIADLPFAFRSVSDMKAGHQGRCGIKSIIGVIATGHYALCGIGTNVPDLNFGKIGETPLKKIWEENKILTAIREYLPQKLEGICGKCIMNGVCRGSCIAQNYYRTGSLWAPYWLCEESERLGLFPESRMR